MKFLAKLTVIGAFLAAVSMHGQSQMENLNRGVVAVRTSTSQVYVGWRLLGTDPSSVSFNVYRAGTKLTSSPITSSTNYVDSTSSNSTYTVRAVVNGVEQGDSESASVWTTNYLQIPLQIPAGGTTPDGVAYTYNANDCSVGDLDGDGQYEIVLKWDPSNSKDNSQSGYTGNVFLDAYKLNGTRLWRIDLGRNIRAGAHYTQFMVYDLDFDGKAEIVCKTAPGTKAGTGSYLSLGPAASDNDATDYRNSSGYILSGPEYLTVFSGLSGAELATVNYNPPRGTVGDWGDTYGNRVDRFLACIAYLDGVHPSVVMCRGYYTRSTLAAYDWNGTTLTQRWFFDSNASGHSGYAGQGCHSLSVADVDGDGKDEIIYGACCIDDNGDGKYTTGLGHGDALHVSKMDPGRSGLQVWQAHEGGTRATYRDANTGAVIFQSTASSDVGRACASNISTSVKGYQMWSSASSTLYNISGGSAGTKPSPCNFVVFWDADTTREIEDGTAITKYGGGTLLTASGCASNNGTKSTPCLSADLLGDWREEVIWRTSNNSYLRIYTTTNVTTTRIFTLMHDRMYREAIAWQNVAYNQPPHPSFYIGYQMTLPVPQPNIVVPGGGSGGNVAPTVSITSPADGATFTAGANITINATAADSDGTVTSVAFYQGATLLGTDTSSPYSYTWNSVAAGTYSLTAVATDDDGAPTTSSPVGITVGSGGGATTYAAESATIGGGAVVESTNGGYHGTGYINFPTTGGSLTFNNVNGGTGGSKTITFRYALASGSRTGTLVINGVSQNITFSATGAWTTWSTLNVTVTLNSGTTNTIQLNSTGQDLANIDELTVP